MATAPSERGPVRGRLDAQDRLISADPELVALQVDAGSQFGSELALPQIRSIARLARKLGVPIYRNAVAAGLSRTLNCGSAPRPKATRWPCRSNAGSIVPPAAPRLGTLVPHEQHIDLGAAPEEWAANEDLSIVSMSSGLAEKLGTTPEEAIGKPLTRFLKLEENEDGELPLLVAATSRSEFDGQRARPRRGSEEALVLRGTPVTSADGRFAGFQGEAVGKSMLGQAPAMDAASQLDEIIDEALRSPLDRIIDAADRIVEQRDGPLAQRLCRLCQRHRRRGPPPAVGHPFDERRGRRRTSDRVDLVALATEAVGLLESTPARRT